MYTRHPTDTVLAKYIFGRRTQLPEVPPVEDTIVVFETYWEQYVNSLSTKVGKRLQ